MKIRPIVIAMVAGLLLPLAGANARAVFDPGLNQAGVPISSAAPTAENFGRIQTEHQGAQNPPPPPPPAIAHRDRCRSLTTPHCRYGPVNKIQWGTASSTAVL